MRTLLKVSNEVVKFNEYRSKSKSRTFYLTSTQAVYLLSYQPYKDQVFVQRTQKNMR